MTEPAIAIHAGCGVMPRTGLSEADWEAARQDLAAALRAGWQVLKGGGSALDAVEAAVVVMEDSPHFNAGHGAALNTAAEHELDASIMGGGDLAAGAVTLLRHVRNPIRAARALLEAGGPVMLGGAAADAFAKEAGLEMVDQAYFTTERRVEALVSLKQRAQDGTIRSASEAEKHGTVGAVALDVNGHLAAATSTGGYNNKPAGRIGDSPLIGAGTYARDGVCAVSGTGAGEFFIRHVVGHEISSRVAYLNEKIAEAAGHVVLTDLARYGIGAGVVAIDAVGNVTAPYNTEGMFRGWITPDGHLSVGTHADIISLPL
ncbi:isoaspartyl peptidase/L-asparaginase [Rhizobium sp. SG570]|uniref:isoaspartyl peptidase/L-asparaginase family protein n=1 Tax=Rhizobium sp. SG570 TaxID=2587113 RepID=UPI001447D51D|nr:isoaspartyl peptidase/L-asparaginase [Rhizobium sp. SG570]NKJ40477.1 beta-aspartyl-peptidase (threonine type) [Rhizobium sp. SG570]